MYKSIRPVSFEFAPGTSLAPIEFMTLDFPEHLKTAIHEEIARVRERKGEESSIPINSLNRAVRTLVPDLISIKPGTAKQGVGNWLYSAEAVSPEALRLIMSAWLRAECPGLDTLLGQVNGLIWKPGSVDVTDWRAGKNGTAEASDEIYFILPDLIASWLSAPDVEFKHGHETLRFRRSPLSPGSSGAELVSWPPLWMAGKETSWPYSITIHISVQTIPFRPTPVIHLELGIRRWVIPDGNIRFKGMASIYLHSKVPWIDQVAQSSSFQVARVHWSHVENGEPEWKLTWADQFGPILSTLSPGHPLFDPDWFIHNRAVGFDGESANAVLVYRNGMNPEHQVAAGLMVGDRKPLVEQIAAVLSPHLVLTPTLERVTVQSMGKPAKRENVLFNFKRSGQEFGSQRRELIAQAVGRKLTVEVYQQRGPTARSLLGKLCAFLGVPLPEKYPSTCHTPELDLALSVEDLGALGSELILDEKKSKKDRHRQALNRRVEEVCNRLGTVQQPTLSLVELDGKGKFSEGADPKNALRVGFAQTGRNTQFIDATNQDATIKDRGSRAILDGLRQLGVRSQPKIERLQMLEGRPEGLRYAGLWLITQTAKTSPSGSKQVLPLFVLVDGNTGEVSVRLAGVERWLSYREALLSVGKGQAQTFRSEPDVMPFVQKVIQNELVPDGNILLMCSAQNVSKAWPWSQNKRMVVDHLAFKDEAAQPIRQFKGLRIARIRSSDNHQTPEWYAEEGGFSKGVFRIGQRVFASTYLKPVQFRKLSHNLSKVTTWQSKGHARNPSPGKQAWNPAMYQATIAAMQEGDSADTLATIVHDLRQASIQYDDATAMPLPLHLAKGIEEYIQTLQFGEEGQEEEEV